MQGKITRWKDDQGFGFITQNGGGEPVFVHVKSFSRHGRRPVAGDLVTYMLTADAKGRTQAAQVAFVETRSTVAAPGGRSSGGGAALLFAGLFLLFVGACVLAGRLPPAVFGGYAGASLLAFVVYTWDKSAARGGHWRTSEQTLHLIALFGGWPGALVAQRVLRHKSSKASFLGVFWATVVLNCGALAWWLMAPGAAGWRVTLGG